MKEITIGNRMKRFRELKGISLEELSKRTGLPLSFLEEMEKGTIFPSLGPILRISRALGTRLGTFIDDYLSKDPLIVRKEDREMEIRAFRHKDSPTSLRFYSLGRGKTDRHMEPFYVEVLPETRNDSFSTHEGEEFIVVLEGEIEVVYGEDRYLLKQGDSIYYNSAVPHRVSCVGDRVAKIYAVLYLP